jgi:phosphate uptake regulator
MGLRVVGRDLRFVISVVKITPILERVADYVTDICELTVYMAEAAFIKHSY